MGVLFEIGTNGKGTTSSRAAPAPTHNSALAAGAASVLAAALLRLQRMDDELARAEAPLYASQSRERTETRGQTGRTPISSPKMGITNPPDDRSSRPRLFPQAFNKINPILVTNNLY